MRTSTSSSSSSSTATTCSMRCAGRATRAASRGCCPGSVRGARRTSRSIVALDGPADRGLGDQRPIAPGISVRHAGSRSADDVIVSIVEARPYADRARTVVVTDDAHLRERVRHAGGIGRRTTWLTGQMARAVTASASDPRPAGNDRRPGTSIGSGRAPTRGAPSDPPSGEGEDERPWQPGRGATKKRGNPRRRATRKGCDPRR